jgi:hypothetical protein
LNADGSVKQAVLKEHRLAAFKKLTDLFFRPDPDKNPPTHFLDDSAYPFEDSFLWPPGRPYLRKWGGWRDDIGLVDNVVYKPGAMSIGGHICLLPALLGC